MRRRSTLIAAAALVLCVALAAGALAASTDFVEPATSPEATGDSPLAIAVGDFDNDGDGDLALPNFFDGDVTVLKNDGSADFTEPNSSPEAANATPRSIAAADFDGDGDGDLAVGDDSPGDVVVLKSNGSGNFTEPSSSPEAAGDLPSSITAADFDADTDVDLAVGNVVSDDVTILRNNGSGNFTEPATSPELIPNAFAMVDRDLDGDGDPDLAAADQGGDAARILLNQ
jgi:hypothetical protein